MNKILEEEPEQIEKEIYQAIGRSKENFEESIFVSTIIDDYFIFKKNIERFNNSEISMNKINSFFYINNFVKFMKDSEDKRSSEMYYKLNSLLLHNKENSHLGIAWVTPPYLSTTQLHPESFEHINIYSENQLEENIEKKIQKFLFKKIKNLSDTYFEDINKLKPFLLSLYSIIKKINAIKFDYNEIFLPNTFHSTLFIYDTLTVNNEIKEILSLSGDFNIEDELAVMKNYNNTSKTGIKLK